MKVKRINNVVKDLSRGSGNRVAEDASVLGEGRNPAEHAHVSKATPLQTKKRELESDLQYQADAINPAREKSTSRKRAAKEVKPI